MYLEVHNLQTLITKFVSIILGGSKESRAGEEGGSDLQNSSKAVRVRKLCDRQLQLPFFRVRSRPASFQREPVH